MLPICVLACGLLDPKAVSISAYMEYLPTSYRGDRQYSVLNSTPSIVFAALPQG